MKSKAVLARQCRSIKGDQTKGNFCNTLNPADPRNPKHYYIRHFAKTSSTTRNKRKEKLKIFHHKKGWQTRDESNVQAIGQAGLISWSRKRSKSLWFSSRRRRSLSSDSASLASNSSTCFCFFSRDLRAAAVFFARLTSTGFIGSNLIGPRSRLARFLEVFLVTLAPMTPMVGEEQDGVVEAAEKVRSMSQADSSSP